MGSTICCCTRTANRCCARRPHTRASMRGDSDSTCRPSTRRGCARSRACDALRCARTQQWQHTAAARALGQRRPERWAGGGRSRSSAQSPAEAATGALPESPPPRALCGGRPAMQGGPGARNGRGAAGDSRRHRAGGAPARSRESQRNPPPPPPSGAEDAGEEPTAACAQCARRAPGGGQRRQRLAGTSPAARTTRVGAPAGEAPDRRAALAVPEAGRSVGGAGAAGGGRWRRAGGAPAPALRLRLAGISPPLQCLDRGARGRKRRGRRQPLEACRRRAGAPLPFSVGGAQGRSWCVARAWRRPAASWHFPRGAYDAPDAGSGLLRFWPEEPPITARPCDAQSQSARGRSRRG